jgi:polysaccharide pyruvyl transferase WcaK-like protein
MNIGVIGWWHQDNQGDLAILDSMVRSLSPHRIVPIDAPFYINRDVLSRLNLLDFLILGGGGLFQEGPCVPFDTFDEWGKELRTPIGVAGLGIDTLPDRYRPAVHALVDQARFFYVRDQTSQEIIGHPQVRLAPDLTFLYPLNRFAKQVAPAGRTPVCGINLRKLPELDIEHWTEALRLLPVWMRAIPFTTFGPMQEIEILQQLDETCPQACDLARYEGLDLMIGMAYHSVVFAIQAAVPVIAITHTPKVRRLMTELALEQYTLNPGEWHRLPNLVERLLAEHGSLVQHLGEAADRLTIRVQQAMRAMRQEIEGAAPASTKGGPKVSLIVVGSSSAGDDRSALDSCLNQTYDNQEVIYLGDNDRLARENPADERRMKAVEDCSTKSLGDCLNLGLAHATGEYISWIMAGDCYAPDAIACMVDCLQRGPGCDMVFTDYYTVHERGRLADIHPVDSARKLFRANVIGPSFLVRRKLAETAGQFRTDTPLVTYDYWLRAAKANHLKTLHVPIFYQKISNRLIRNPSLEREVRHQWRSSEPWLRRTFWRLVDTATVEDLIISPLLAGLHKARAWLGQRTAVRLQEKA